MLKSKKGISAVVATILIILIVVVAVGILWTALRPTIEEGSEQAGTTTSCMYLRLEIEKINVTDDEIIVYRDTGRADLSDVKILIGEKEVEKTPEEVPGELESETYKVTYDIEEGDKIRIAGVIGETTCSVSDMKTA